MIKRIVLPAALLAVMTTGLSAGNARLVESKSCKTTTTRLTSDGSLRYKAFSDDGKYVVMSGYMGFNYILNCSSENILSLATVISSPYPDETWFFAVGAAGAQMSGLNREEVQKAVKHCHGDAIASDSGAASTSLRTMDISCEASIANNVTAVMIVSPPQ